MEIGVFVINRGFKRNLTQLTSMYDLNLSTHVCIAELCNNY